ncbi:hypothetical protein FRC20_003762 [Serendipita sp. 405]|nr:hypothetical protein FRC20_003762 [Serendipita sp. 405]
MVYLPHRFPLSPQQFPRIGPIRFEVSEIGKAVRSFLRPTEWQSGHTGKGLYSPSPGGIATGEQAVGHGRMTIPQQHWIINGTKKWITNGTFCDYFTVGCRTDGGFTVILVERAHGGVETMPIKTSYSSAAGTAYITFDNVKVPVENTLGPENAGLLVMLSNFNHERWVMTCASIRSQRLIVEECLKWANQREVFGKPLFSQAVIRHKLAAMIARVESAQAWLENITYQMTKMTYKQQSAKLAGQIAFIKMYATRTAQETARDAVQIFGGRGISQKGMGRHIEHYHRTITFDSLLGGAEDVLGDLGVRQAIKQMPKNVRL